MEVEKFNIYQKMMLAKVDFHERDIKKSGHNDYQGFDYFELEDIVPHILECLRKQALFPHTYLTTEAAILRIVDMENTDECLTYTIPYASCNIKGANVVQNIGGAVTFYRRYLYQLAFDIIEPDMFDRNTKKETQAPVETTDRKTALVRKVVNRLAKLSQESKEEIMRQEPDKPFRDYTIEELESIDNAIDLYPEAERKRDDFI